MGENKIMELDGHVLKYPGHRISLRNYVDEGDESGLNAALDTVDLFRAEWEPLSAEAVLTCLNSAKGTEHRPEKAHWHIHCHGLSPDIVIASRRIDPIQEQTANLSRAKLESWLKNALFSCGCEGPEHQAAWRQIYFGACRVRIGPPEWRAGRNELHLRTDAGILTAPLERDEHGTWLSGPRRPAFDQPALELSLLQRWGELTLDLNVHYSFWLEERETAGAGLEALLGRLEEQGWER